MKTNFVSQKNNSIEQLLNNLDKIVIIAYQFISKMQSVSKFHISLLLKNLVFFSFQAGKLSVFFWFIIIKVFSLVLQNSERDATNALPRDYIPQHFTFLGYVSCDPQNLHLGLISSEEWTYNI